MLQEWRVVEEIELNVVSGYRVLFSISWWNSRKLHVGYYRWSWLKVLLDQFIDIYDAWNDVDVWKTWNLELEMIWMCSLRWYFAMIPHFLWLLACTKQWGTQSTRSGIMPNLNIGNHTVYVYSWTITGMAKWHSVHNHIESLTLTQHDVCSLSHISETDTSKNGFPRIWTPDPLTPGP